MKELNKTIELFILAAILLILFTLISGCSSLNQALKAADKLSNASFYTGTDKTNWDEMAGFYASNYPDCDRNEKVEMLMRLMDSEKQEYIVIEKTHTYVEKRIMINGRIIWPVGLDNHGSTLKEQSLDRKEQEEVK